MRLDELPTSDRIEDRRRIPGGRAGLGICTVVILGLLAWVFGIDPRVLIGGAEMMSRNGQTQQQTDAGSNETELQHGDRREASSRALEQRCGEFGQLHRLISSLRAIRRKRTARTICLRRVAV